MFISNDFCIIITNYLLTKSEVFIGKPQTEALPYP